MDNYARKLFQELSDSELLSTISFFQIDYNSETQSVLKQVAEERGITITTIKQYRENCYAELDLECKCNKCGDELTLDRTDFINGDFNCPECGTTNMINYINLKLPDSDYEVNSKIAVVAASSIAGAIFLSVRENQKRDEQKKRILDGTYWKALQEIAKLKSED